jgi:folate-binding protein YgfZ
VNDVERQVLRVRESAGLFGFAEELGRRGLVAVTGRDARRWLDGMLTNDVTRIAPGTPESGCYAALLTPKGRIVADLHVLAREDGFWLETAASAVADVVARLERYIVADDVKLAVETDEILRLGLEGPGAAAVLAAAGSASAPALTALAPESWLTTQIAGTDVVAARFGWSGESGFQLFVPVEAGDAVGAALADAGGDALVPASGDALEVLRIEAGIPRLGPELNEEIFPDEARLDRAISRRKGCYTGQEIVARLYSRGAVNHLLVGLRFEDERVPAPDAPLAAGDRPTGEVTSACRSPRAGVIGLGFVRREHAEAGTSLRCDDPAGPLAATVCEPPFFEMGVDRGVGADAR